MSNKYVGAANFFKNLVFGKPKVYPTIKSVKPNLTKTVKQSKSDEFSKRINLLNKAESKLKTGKEMMKEAQKVRKNLVDTGRAFQFKHSKSYHAVNPGDKTKYLSAIKEPKPPKKFKKGKELASGGRVGKKFGGGMDMGRRKTNIEKIKETFGPKKNLSPKQMKIAKLAGNKNKIDAADFAKLRSKRT
tara:strand:- start:43 stop:606 length:564 start_codon:yes stop_codon:yes gene_type:complete